MRAGSTTQDATEVTERYSINDIKVTQYGTIKIAISYIDGGSKPMNKLGNGLCKESPGPNC